MTRKLALIPLLIVMAGCTGSAPVKSASITPSREPVATPGEPSPSPPPSSPLAPAYGVLVDLLSYPDLYNLYVVGTDGGLVQQMQLARRTVITTPAGHAIELPYVSTSLTALYYLTGDSTVMALRLSDGSQRPVYELSPGRGQEAAFAVSPDDSRIAVSVLDFTGSKVSVTLYTDDLAGGSKKVIFTSTSDYVWPVAWHAGLLVLAHAYGPYEEDIARVAPDVDNPYSAISYHLVDPANANRVVLMGACTVSGPLSPSGSGCIQGGSIDWLGHVAAWNTHDWGSISAAAALSPDGQWMAATNPDDQTEMGIWGRAGNLANWVPGPGARDWAGWLDGETIMVGSYRDATWSPIVVNVIRGGYVHSLNLRGFYAARLPTDIY